MLTPQQLEARLQAAKPYLEKAFGVDRIGYFGSFAKGTYRPESDVDLLVSLSRPVGWAFFDLKDYLEKIVGREVDLVTEQALRPQWREAVLQQVHYIIEEKDPLAPVEDMIAAIDKVLRYLGTVADREAFLANEMVIDAVIRNYEIIGKAANKVPAELRNRYPEIPWRQMYGLPNLAVHEYQLVDPSILWQIAHDHLADNRAQLQQVLRAERA